MSEDCHDSGGGPAQVIVPGYQGYQLDKEKKYYPNTDEENVKEQPPVLRATINVYMDDGNVFYYDVEGVSEFTVSGKAREHCAAIIATGYRHNDGQGTFEHYPSHRISKVKVTGIPIDTKYVDIIKGT